MSLLFPSLCREHHGYQRCQKPLPCPTSVPMRVHPFLAMSTRLSTKQKEAGPLSKSHWQECRVPSGLNPCFATGQLLLPKQVLPASISRAINEDEDRTIPAKPSGIFAGHPNLPCGPCVLTLTIQQEQERQVLATHMCVRHPYLAPCLEKGHSEQSTQKIWASFFEGNTQEQS